MKYFRSYPWGLQLLLFLLMVFTFMSAAGVIIPGILTKTTGFTAMQMEGIGPASSPALVNASLIVEGVLNLFIFCIPALLFAYLSTPRPASYLGLRKPVKNVQLLLAIMVILGATPILQATEGLISQIDFGAKVKASQKANDDMMTAFLNMKDFGSFLKVFLLVAVIPGIGEELFFRGVLMRFAKKRSRSMLFPILFTAAVFAYAHSNIYGYLSIFFAGILLAVIYNLTGSLWCSIAAHISFNGLQILISYLGRGNAGVKAFMESNSTPWFLVLAGAVMFAGSFYLLWQNRTPLPSTWTDDFNQEEISRKAY
jgi:membrane protease YdiL (CAAX protease family)